MRSLVILLGLVAVCHCVSLLDMAKEEWKVFKVRQTIRGGVKTDSENLFFGFNREPLCLTLVTVFYSFLLAGSQSVYFVTGQRDCPAAVTEEKLRQKNRTHVGDCD